MSRTTNPEPPVPDELALEVWDDEAPATLPAEPDRIQDDDEPRHLRDIPIGAGTRGWRTERDWLGPVAVPSDRYWGAQTQRSLEHFAIGRHRMPIEVYRAYGHVKKAAAMANVAAGILPKWKAAAIVRACDEITAGLLDDHLPLDVYQSGSGTQTNANVNEVIANRGNQLLGARLGADAPLHPNDDVNMSQSSNDTFVTAMHVAAYRVTAENTLPALSSLRSSLAERADDWALVLKVGRTHLMDATPLTVGEEWSGYVAALGQAMDDVRARDGRTARRGPRRHGRRHRPQRSPRLHGVGHALPRGVDAPARAPGRRTRSPPRRPSMPWCGPTPR